MKKLTNHEFIEKAISIHGDLYNYDKFNYFKSSYKSIITCKIHGDFEQSPNNHLSGKGCRYCKQRSYSYTTDEIIEKFIDSHGDKYDYSLVEYKNLTTKVRIICPIGGEFDILPQNHYRGYGCSCCSSHRSSGEELIQTILNNYNVKTLPQHTFDDCINKYKLRFDFYLPDYNICIEYDGLQHYKPIEWFGGIEGFEKTLLRDQIKNDYCTKNGINLYRIKYNDNIELKINQLLEILNNDEI